VSEAPAQTARHRSRAQSRQQGRTPKDTTRLWAGWGLVCPPVAPALLRADTLSALDRVRWPSEVAIQRWQSVWDVGQ